MASERVSELERRLADLRKRLPAHSIRPEMLAELEELEDELAEARMVEEGDIGGTRSDRYGEM